jgi:hypothetical protein
MSALLLAMALAAGQADGPPYPPDREVVFARGSQGGWTLEALTTVDEGSPGREGFPATQPTISQMGCSARRNGLAVSLSREGSLSFAIEANLSRRGRVRPLHGYDLRSLVLDGATWEVRAGVEHDFTERFTDIAYPDAEVGISSASDWQLNIRRPGLAAWLSIHDLADDLLHAHRLRLSFREDVEEVNAPGQDVIWIDVPLDGLEGALGWCQRIMASPEALRLHPQGVGPAPTDYRVTRP